MLSRRIDPSPKELFKTTVECVAYVKVRDSQKLLCGLSSGGIQVIDFASGRTEVFIPAHKQIITCMLPFYPVVWTGSFDKSIKIVDLRTKRATKTLLGHKDAITCLTEGTSDDVWSCGLNGQLVRWNKTNQQRLTDIDFVLRSPNTGRFLPLYSLKVIGGKLWIGTGNSIRVVDPNTRAIDARLPQLAPQRPRSSSQPSNPLSPADDAKRSGTGGGFTGGGGGSGSGSGGDCDQAAAAESPCRRRTCLLAFRDRSKVESKVFANADQVLQGLRDKGCYIRTLPDVNLDAVASLQHCSLYLVTADPPCA
eukprot:m.351818 g.351818  ORF g.351818 m.351818 type:complete len:308 (+) comp19898_c9_seq3:328-1251(+)